MMGTDNMGPNLEREHPAHLVTVPPFSIEVTEVTVAQYRGCITAGACAVTSEHRPGYLMDGCTLWRVGRDDHPINCVTWDQASAYCKWAERELPTEDLWEFAARGKHGRWFPWGNAVPGTLWGLPDEFMKVHWCPDLLEELQTCPVGNASKANTPEGVNGMAGNVDEWTASPFCLYRNPNCGAQTRVVRGGTNGTDGFWMRGTVRRESVPNEVSMERGFRCVKRDP